MISWIAATATHTVAQSCPFYLHCLWPCNGQAALRLHGMAPSLSLHMGKCHKTAALLLLIVWLVACHPCGPPASKTPLTRHRTLQIYLDEVIVFLFDKFHQRKWISGFTNFRKSHQFCHAFRLYLTNLVLLSIYWSALSVWKPSILVTFTANKGMVGH